MVRNAFAFQCLVVLGLTRMMAFVGEDKLTRPLFYTRSGRLRESSRSSESSWDVERVRERSARVCMDFENLGLARRC